MLYMYVYMSIYLSVCPCPVCLSACLPACQSVCLSVPDVPTYLLMSPGSSKAILLAMQRRQALAVRKLGRTAVEEGCSWRTLQPILADSRSFGGSLHSRPWVSRVGPEARGPQSRGTNRAGVSPGRQAAAFVDFCAAPPSTYPTENLQNYESQSSSGRV